MPGPSLVGEDAAATLGKEVDMDMPGEDNCRDVVRFTGQDTVRGQAHTDRLAKLTVLLLVKPVNHISSHRGAE